MLKKGVTLRGLEVFEALASCGSVAQAADRTGLSQPAVSQQLRNLEIALGIELLDHKRRPMRLTPAGVLFLARAKAALNELRAAQSELTVMDLAHIDALDIGIIDDFDDKITPQLATILADHLSDCRLKIITATSNELIGAITRNELHLAITAKADFDPEGLVEYPLARDPFMIVAPRSSDLDPATLVSQSDLPFLRYDKEQLISCQIEAALTEQNLTLTERFEIGSHLALMSMVASGIGWAITTPLGYMRAHRFRDQVQASPWPFSPFSRQISVYASGDWSDEVPLSVAQTLRGLIQSQMIDPALPDMTFLKGAFCVLESDETTVKR